MAAKRTWQIEEAADPETGAPLGVYDREQALQLLSDLESVLATVGGMVSLATDRVVSGQAVNGDTLAESRALLVTWSSFAPLREEGEPPEVDDVAVPGPDADELELPDGEDPLSDEERAALAQEPAQA